MRILRIFFAGNTLHHTIASIAYRLNSIECISMIRLSPYLFAGIIALAIGIGWLLTYRYYSEKRQKTLDTMSQLDSSLMESNEIIQRSSQNIFYEMSERLKDPSKAERAKIYYPLLDASVENANRLSAQIDKIKWKLKSEAKHGEADSINRFNQNNTSAVRKVIISNYEGKRLRDSLKSFTETIERLVPETKNRAFPILQVSSLLEKDLSDNDWVDNLFGHIASREAITLLSKIENDIICSENTVAEYCKYMSTPGCDLSMDKYSVIVSQNTTYLLAGDTLKIKAGIGGFSSAIKPHIVIGKKRCELSDYGYATYELIANRKGKNTIPVEISYLDPNTGKPLTKTTAITYFVDER